MFTNKSCPGTVFLLTTVPWANEYEAVKLGSQYDAGTSVALVSVQPIRLSKGLIAVLRHVSFFKPGSQNNAGAVRVTSVMGESIFPLVKFRISVVTIYPLLSYLILLATCAP